MTEGQPSNPRRVGIYARVSTEDQDPAPQVERVRGWAEANGHEVVGVWTETVSGADHNRAAQMRLMGEAMGRRVTLVACAKLDRWARSVSHMAESIETLLDRGVHFCAVDQGLYVRPNDPTSRLIVHILGAAAEWEASIISERTRDALAARKASGAKLGHPHADCYVCGGPRTENLYAKVNGQRVALCPQCKELDPAIRRHRVQQTGGSDAYKERADPGGVG